MTDILSCRWNRSVFTDPENLLPLPVSGYEVATPSPWTNPLMTLTPVNLSSPLPPGLTGGAPGSDFTQPSPGSPAYREAELLFGIDSGREQLGFPALSGDGGDELADSISAANASGLVQYTNGSPFSSAGIGEPIPAGTPLIYSTQVLPAYNAIRQPGCGTPSGCMAASNTGMGAVGGDEDDTVSETPNQSLFQFLLERPMPSITGARSDSSVPAVVSTDGDSLLCRFSRWVHANPGLALLGLVSIYALRKR